jgi:restriction system protein
MAGRGREGLLITTGSFTRDAQAEGTRDGAPQYPQLRVTSV